MRNTVTRCNIDSVENKLTNLFSRCIVKCQIENLHADQGKVYCTPEQYG